MSHARKAFLVAAALILPARLAGGAQPPTIQIDFAIAEADYRAEYNEEQLTALRAEGASLLAGLLGDNLGFLAFSPLGGPLEAAETLTAAETDCPESGADYRLCVRLDGLVRGARGVAQEVGLHFELDGPSVRQDEAHGYWPFRSREEWQNPIPEPRDLLAEMALKFEHADFGGLVRQVLAQVQLSDHCDVRREAPSGWILPFTGTDLCMDRGSELAIRHELVISAIAQELTFSAEAIGALTAPGSPEHGRLYLKPAAGFDAGRLEELLGAPADAVGRTAVFVIDYKRLDSDCAGEATSPAEVDFGEDSP